MDWLKRAVKTVVLYHEENVVIIKSIAAKRTQNLYYRKTDISKIRV